MSTSDGHRGRRGNRGQRRGRGRGRGRGSGRPDDDQPRVEQTGFAFVQEDVPPRAPPTPSASAHASESDESVEDARIRARMPPLASVSRGPPVVVRGRVGGAMMVDPRRDPRLAALSMGFPVSVHPLRLPNARGLFSSASTTSVVDYTFVRLAGLLHRMVPLRYGVDDVQLGTVMTDGNEMEVFGRVPVVFDAGGFEFSMQCWVVNVGLPVELVLGLDWMDNFSPTVSFEAGGVRITQADAKRVRDLQDVYVAE